MPFFSQSQYKNAVSGKGNAMVEKIQRRWYSALLSDQGNANSNNKVTFPSGSATFSNVQSQVLARVWKSLLVDIARGDGDGFEHFGGQTVTRQQIKNINSKTQKLRIMTCAPETVAHVHPGRRAQGHAGERHQKPGACNGHIKWNTATAGA